MMPSTVPTTNTPKKKHYYADGNGGFYFKSERKPGEVRVPNYIWDLWMPLLGVEAIGLYAVYCRLEREEMVKGMSISDLARATRMGERSLLKYNTLLEKHGLIKIRKPSGAARLKHFTTVVIVCDAPQAVTAEAIEELALPSGYQPLSNWLTDHEANCQLTMPKESTDNTGIVIRQHDALSVDNAKIATSILQPLDIEEKKKESANAEAQLLSHDLKGDVDIEQPIQVAAAKPVEAETETPPSSAPPKTLTDQQLMFAAIQSSMISIGKYREDSITPNIKKLVGETAKVLLTLKFNPDDVLSLVEYVRDVAEDQEWKTWSLKAVQDRVGDWRNAPGGKYVSKKKPAEDLSKKEGYQPYIPQGTVGARYDDVQRVMQQFFGGSKS